MGIIEYVEDNLVVIVSILSLLGIEFSKIKISPISAMLKWIGGKMLCSTDETLFLMIWSQLESKCEACLIRGLCNDHEKYCIEALFKEYQKRGGNHGMELKVNDVMNLPKDKVVV